MSNNRDEIKILYDAYEDGFFRLVMNNVAEKEGKLLFDENEMLKGVPGSIPSEEDIKKFSQLLDFRLKKSKHRHNAPRFSKMINRATVAALAIIIVFSATMVTVQAFRIQVLNFLISIESKYTAYRLSGGDENNKNKAGLAVNWTNAYVPTYIPEDYEVTSIFSSDALKKIILTNKKDKALYIIYCEYSSFNSIAVDTENASLVKKVKINGEDGTLSVKDTTVTVAWIIDEHLFTVQGSLNTDEAVRLAESVKFNK